MLVLKSVANTLKQEINQMHQQKRTILLKLSGEFFAHDISTINALVAQVKSLMPQVSLGIIVGAGNIWRGAQERTRFDMDGATADEIGMLATVLNGRTLQHIFTSASIPNVLVSAIACPSIALPLSQQVIDAQKKNHCIIFAGGSGNPFFTTDTAAVIRALQLGALEVWKATTVDGVYSDDPHHNEHAEKFARISFDDAINRNIKVMDQTAMTLARTHNLSIRVFNFTSENALIRAYNEPDFGSTVHV